MTDSMSKGLPRRMDGGALLTGLPPSEPQLSQAMTLALADSGNVAPAGDGLAWEPPKNLSARAIDEAKQAADRYAQFLEPAPLPLRQRWLMQLGILCAGNPTVEDAAAKVAAFTPLLNYPAFAFTGETLEAVARANRFFPALMELTKTLDEVVAPHHERLRRLRRIAALKALPPPAPKPAEDVVRPHWRSIKRDELTAAEFNLFVEANNAALRRADLSSIQDAMDGTTHAVGRPSA